jgi:hypothetical protein
VSKRFKRRESTRQIANKILIVCEGSKTEPAYFNAIRQTWRLATLQVLIVPSHGKTDPYNLVELAIEKRQELEDDDRWEKGDRAWVAFDGDEHIAKSLDAWNEALSKARGQKIELAVTNPCFELWYLLHFQDHFSQITSKKAKALLNTHLPTYHKAKCYYPETLEALTQFAIQRAEKIAAQIQRDNLDEFSNPCCSGLPTLVQNLLMLNSR